MADFLAAVDTDGGRAEPTPVTLVSGGAEIGTSAKPFKMGAAGATFTDRSTPSLSSGQAAGTTTILAANTSRTALKIVPPADCTLTIASASTVGIPLYGGVSNDLSGNDCPTNDLFVRGLSVSAALIVWEA